MNRSLSKYRTNKTIKKKIDNQLLLLARVYANHGTNSKHDEGDNKSNIVSEIKQKIKDLSPIFYDSIYPYDKSSKDE